jgi:hypothetical protein
MIHGQQTIKVTRNVQTVPLPVSRHLLARRTVLEDRDQCSTVRVQYSTVRVQYNTVRVPNAFCDGHLQIVNCVRIVRIHLSFSSRPRKKNGGRRIRRSCRPNVWSSETVPGIVVEHPVYILFHTETHVPPRT